MSITIETVGRRHYITGNTYPMKDQIRAAGCHWDGERRAWWTAKRDVADRFAGAEAPAAEATNQSGGDNTVVAGSATYQDKTYYIVGRVVRGRTRWDDRVDMVTAKDGARVLLAYRDGSRTFWAPTGFDPTATTIHPRDIGGEDCARIVRRYSKPQTIGGLRRFAADLKAGKIATCRHCGSPSCEGAHGGPCEED